MDHNRRGLALMLSVLLVSVLVVSIRSCNDTAAVRLEGMDAANRKLIAGVQAKTAPIHDYHVSTIENGTMEVVAGPTLSVDDAGELAGVLTGLLHDVDSPYLHSDFVGVEINRAGRPLAIGQTSESGVQVKTNGTWAPFHPRATTPPASKA